jgi:predicted PurR-regulated permease PerM
MREDARPPGPFSGRETRHISLVAWIITGGALFLVLKLHCLSALFAGLLVHELVSLLVPFVEKRMTSKGARLLAVSALATLTVALLTLSIVAILAFFKNDSGNIHRVINKSEQILIETRTNLPPWLLENLPGDIDSLRSSAGQWVDQHSEEIRHFGTELTHFFVRSLIGMVIGALISLHGTLPASDRMRPLAAALASRVSRFAHAFRQVIFAQVKISAANTFLTAIFLLGILPLLGVRLPLAKTLILVTFITGLLPVIGNLISNTLICIAGLSISIYVAVGALIFLVVIHKLEYFLNARIVGTRIQARAWELLIAMLAMEVAFGIAGLIAAPVYYAYIKQELTDAGLF